MHVIGLYGEICGCLGFCVNDLVVLSGLGCQGKGEGQVQEGEGDCKEGEGGRKKREGASKEEGREESTSKKRGGLCQKEGEDRSQKGAWEPGCWAQPSPQCSS